MESFDLDTKLLEFGAGNDLSKNWCIKHSILGLQAFGANGSGKSSSMKIFALKMLRAGYGFLILSVKSERETWEEYCRIAGRSKDFIRIGEGSPARFDFMKYLASNSTTGKFTSNLLNILSTVIKTMDGRDENKSADAFWDKSLNLLLHNTISLCQLAYGGNVSIQLMYDIIQSAPKGSEDGEDEQQVDVSVDNAFNRAFKAIKDEIAVEYQAWKKTWTEDEDLRFKDRALLEEEVLRRFPKARPFKFVEQFFFETFKTLSFKTKSIILLSVSSFLFNLLQDPIYTLFCSGHTNISPEDNYAGKVILLDLPTKIYGEAGKSAQALYKYIWQLQVEKRDKKGDIRPICLWSDENAEWITEHDAIFQSTARDCRIAMVYICQNVHQYYAALGGKNASDRVASFLATLNTKIWFSNSCATTNKQASELIGDALFFEPSRTVTTAEKFSQTDSVSLKVDRIIRENQFTNLLTGGRSNNCIVEAYIHVQGDKLFDGKAFKKIRFNQNYQ